MAEFILEFFLSCFGDLVAAPIPTGKDKDDDDRHGQPFPTSEW
jgi:hypothetical protein